MGALEAVRQVYAQEQGKTGFGGGAIVAWVASGKSFRDLGAVDAID